MNVRTQLAQLGNRSDPTTGAVAAPIHVSTTFAHPGLGESTGYDYARTLNPTRHLVEEAIAELEQGVRGLAFSSGMAAITCIMHLFKPGDHIIVSHDLYGGTYRLLKDIWSRYDLDVSFVDMSNLDIVQQAIQERTKAFFIETPTNPTMQITDIQAVVRLATENHLLTIVDNTFMTPYLQLPLTLGADIVVHSATKYLGGHNDVLAGLIAVKDQTVGDTLYFLQNSMGATLGPHESWLLIRGMKTLALRMDQSQKNAMTLAKWLQQHSLVAKVYYPGLDDSPMREVQLQQAAGFGGMLSFEVIDQRMIPLILSRIRLITFAESLGGVESLLTYPARQTHFDMPEDVRNAAGVTDRLLRLSVGIEDVQDLIRDLMEALQYASQEIQP